MDAQDLPLSEQDVIVLGDARIHRWNLEQYKFAVDITVKRVTNLRLMVPLLTGVGAAILLGLRVIVPDAFAGTQWVLSVFGVVLTVLTMVSLVANSVYRLDLRIKGLMERSEEAKKLVGEHEKLSSARPLSRLKINKWICATIDFRETQDPLFDVHDAEICRGYHHIGKLYNKCGVQCSECGKAWKPEYAKAKVSRWFKSKKNCGHCGVKL